MNTIKLICSWCEKEFKKSKGEYNRKIRLEKNEFFCCLSCSSYWKNEVSGKKNFEIEKTCPCGKSFLSNTGSKASSHCSPSCASKYSVTEKRLKGSRRGGLNSAHTPKQAQASLKSREAWKYVDLKDFLDFMRIDYELEFLIDRHVIDLVLKDKMLAIEFDGKYHYTGKQSIKDSERDKLLKSKGFVVERIKVKEKSIINPKVIYHLVK